MVNTTNTATTLNGTILVNGSASLTTCTTGATLTVANTGATLTVANGGAVWSDRSHIDDVKDYIDFTLELMSIDLNFDKFSRMSTDEKKAMIREMKINKIID
jgi:hypothetical protein